jgi:hypothetical protein
MAGSPSEFWHGGLAELPSDAQFTSGPRATFSAAFQAAYDDQMHNWSALGMMLDFHRAEQKQLDAIYAATGQRLAPLVYRPLYVALAKQINGDTLDDTDKEALAAIQPREDYIAKLRQTHPEIPTYQDLWNGVKANAQQYEQTAADTADRERTFGGWLGDIVGRMAGSFTIRDPMNVVTLGVGGMGRAALTRIASEAGFNSLTEAIDQFTGVQQNRQLLGLDYGPGQALEQIAMAGVGAGVFRGLGEGVAAIGKSIAGRAASRTAKTLADAAGVAEDAQAVAGRSPFGSSRVAEGVHQAELADAFNRFDTPMFVPPATRSDLMSGVSIPTLAARENDGMFTATGNDAFFVGTASPLKDVIVKDIPALRASASIEDRAVADHFADLNSRVAISDVKQTAVQARLDAVAAAATPDHEVSEMLSQLADANEAIQKLRTRAPDTVTSAGRVLTDKEIAAMRKAPEQSRANAQELKRLEGVRTDLEARISKAQAVAADVRALTSTRDTIADQGNDIRLQRARLVAAQARKRPAIGTPPPTPEQEAMIRNLLGASRSAETINTRAPGTATFSDALDAAQKVLDDRAAPNVRMTVTADGQSVDLGAGPISLDHEIITGIGADGEPTKLTVRELMQDLADDAALVKQMRECLL